jgi:hypothetical protein
VPLRIQSTSESPYTALCLDINRGDQFTGTPTTKPETHTSQSPLTICITDKADPIFADRQSRVIFTFSLIRATSDHISVWKFCKVHRLTPTLHLVIPSTASDSAAAPTGATNDVKETFRLSSIIPSFFLTLPLPTATPPSPIHYPRQQFGALQQRLFPIYFKLNTIICLRLSALADIAFVCHL